MTTPNMLRVAAVALLVACCSAATTAAQRRVPRVKKSLTREDRAAWRGVLGWPRACEEAFAGAYAGDEKYAGVEFHALGRGTYLVEVTCDGGGIQPSSVFVLYDESRPRRARLLRLRGFGEGEGVRRAGRYSLVRALTLFDARGRELSVMSKYDAMGTCGLFVRYRFTARGRARVVEAREQTECGARDATPDTSRWPRTRI